MRRSFNVVTEPWIPVVRPDGSTDLLNLRDVLVGAHQIREIRDAFPIVEFGLYRLLVAMVLDIFSISSAHALSQLLRDGCLDAVGVDSYLEQNYDKLDVFDPRHPFLQTPGMEGEDEKPLAALFPVIPSGSAANHFHHHMEQEFTVAPAVAARLLTTLAPFMTAGGGGFSPSINGAPPWYVLIEGSSLFHTICYNCPTRLYGEMAGTAPPAWRNSVPPQEARCTKASLLEALTWRPRRVQLIPNGPGVCAVTGVESDVTVGRMRFKAGASCDFTWFDPSVPYRITDQQARVMRPQDGKELWRDTGPLLLLGPEDYNGEDSGVRYLRPALVEQFDSILPEDRSSTGTSFCVRVYGLRTDLRMKVFEWQKERLAVPLELVRGGLMRGLAQVSIDEASRVEYALGKSIKHLYPYDGRVNKNALDTVIANARRGFWSSLRTKYNDILNEIATIEVRNRTAGITDEERSTQSGRILDEWRAAMKRSAQTEFERVAKEFGVDAKALRRLATARSSLQGSFAFVTLGDRTPNMANATSGSDAHPDAEARGLGQ
jgi:CRISPR system Cascade subunit CasA